MYVWSPGNASDPNSRAAGVEFTSQAFSSGDNVTVVVDLQLGTIMWLKNGEAMCAAQGNLVGPVSLMVSCDYTGESVTIEHSNAID